MVIVNIPEILWVCPCLIPGRCGGAPDEYLPLKAFNIVRSTIRQHCSNGAWGKRLHSMTLLNLLKRNEAR